MSYIRLRVSFNSIRIFKNIFFFFFFLKKKIDMSQETTFAKDERHHKKSNFNELKIISYFKHCQNL